MQTGRNDPCPCGSGKKFKKCCLGKGQPAAVSPTIPPRSPASFLQPSGRAAVPSSSPPVITKPPPEPYDPAIERWNTRWQEFKSQEGEARNAVFLQTLDDKELITDEMAFEMLNLLHQDAILHGERAKFAELVSALAVRQPEVYQQGAHYYLSWRLQDALAEKSPDILTLTRELAAKAGQDIDTVNRSLLALAYHGELAALIEAMRIGWPGVQSSSDILPWGISEFAEKGANFEIFNFLEHTPSPDPQDSALLDRIKFFIAEPNLDHLAKFIGDLTGQTAPAWTVDDFTLKPSRKKRRDDWFDDEDEEREEPLDQGALNLSRLISQFVGYLRREEGVPYPKGNLIQKELFRYFIQRHEGNLDPKPSMLEQAYSSQEEVASAAQTRTSSLPGARNV